MTTEQISGYFCSLNVIQVIYLIHNHSIDDHVCIVHDNGCFPYSLAANTYQINE